MGMVGSSAQKKFQVLWRGRKQIFQPHKCANYSDYRSEALVESAHLLALQIQLWPPFSLWGPCRVVVRG